MLILSRKINEKVIINDDITISIIEIRGDQVRIGIDAPKKVKVFRQEVYDAIKAENKAASKSASVIPHVEFVKKQ
ncbi:MAG: carbon storage regulator CsrA [Treponema sp.]|jgi:carbon storage regulator|nr:carbon storage regulator CsrA [Treponema sp.]